jgi:RNA polymerase sigma factor (sigma-70 family)
MSSERAAPAEPAVHRDGLAGRAGDAVVAYREGDLRAFDALVGDLTPLMWHTARSQGADRQQAEEVVQSVWLALIRDLAAIRDPKATLQWVLVTTRRAAWRAVQRARDESARTTTDERVMDWLLAPASEQPSAVVERDGRDRVLWRHVSALSERCRQLLRLVSLVDRPDYTAVSAALGMPVGSIGPTRGRCLAKLRLSLSSDPEWSL